MASPFFKIIILTLLTVFGKIIENANKFKNNENNIKHLYEIYNIHLCLSLGILGLAWSANLNAELTITLTVFIFVGLASKGAFSGHNPESWNPKDKDALFGLYIPNGCGIASVIFMILIYITG